MSRFADTALLVTRGLAAVAVAGAIGVRAMAAQPVDGLRIVVVEGEDAVNIIQQKTAVAPVVEVRDRNDQPVAGAIVNFAIRGGRATFGGARTLSVTTNAAGRAIAAGFAPTGSGALQISATAAFQGQTAAAVTIAQTTVQTVAEAAAVSSAGAGAGGSGGSASASAAGGGGSGGLSGTTLGVVGGAAAGGALVAVNALGGDGAPAAAGAAPGAAASAVTRTYRGSFSMQSVFNSTTTTNGVVTGFCANQPVSITGNITVALDENGAGDADAEWTETIGAAGLCPGIAPSFRTSGRVSSAASVTLASETGTAEYQSPAGTVRLRRSWTFSGALNGNVVNGIVTMLQDQTLIAPAGPGIALNGGYPAATTAVTLTQQ